MAPNYWHTATITTDYSKKYTVGDYVKYNGSIAIITSVAISNINDPQLKCNYTLFDGAKFEVIDSVLAGLMMGVTNDELYRSIHSDILSNLIKWQEQRGAKNDL